MTQGDSILIIEFVDLRVRQTLKTLFRLLVSYIN